MSYLNFTAPEEGIQPAFTDLFTEPPGNVIDAAGIDNATEQDNTGNTINTNLVIVT